MRSDDVFGAKDILRLYNRAGYGRLPQVVYEKGIAKGKEEGKLEGQKMLVKLVLRQRMAMNEWEEKQIDELDEEKLLDLIQSLDAIHTSEDFQRQIHDKTNQNVHMKQTVLNR